MIKITSKNNIGNDTERRKCNRNDCLYKDQEEFWLRFSMIPIYNSENELSHWVILEMLRKRNQEKKRTSDKRINSKQ
jgi:hypothetical protein